MENNVCDGAVLTVCALFAVQTWACNCAPCRAYLCTPHGRCLPIRMVCLSGIIKSTRSEPDKYIKHSAPEGTNLRSEVEQLFEILYFAWACDDLFLKRKHNNNTAILRYISPRTVIIQTLRAGNVCCPQTVQAHVGQLGHEKKKITRIFKLQKKYNSGAFQALVMRPRVPTEKRIAINQQSWKLLIDDWQEVCLVAGGLTQKTSKSLKLFRIN